MTRISVVVCTRNRAHLLERSLESLLDQDLAPNLYEIVVVDNASTDHTRGVVQAIMAKRAVLYVYEGAKGLDRARNAGVRAAMSDIIATTDDDVIVHRDWLSTILRELDADPTVAIVCGMTYGGEGVPPEFSLKLDTERYHVSDYHDIYRCGGQLNAGHRKEVFQIVGEFDPDLDVGAKYPGGGDSDFMYRVLRKGLKVLYSPAVRVRHEPDLRARTVAGTVLSYDAGTAAWQAKHVAHGDWFLLKLFLQRLRRAAAIRSSCVALLKGDAASVVFNARRVGTLLLAFVSRLCDEWRSYSPSR